MSREVFEICRSLDGTENMSYLPRETENYACRISNYIKRRRKSNQSATHDLGNKFYKPRRCMSGSILSVKKMKKTKKQKKKYKKSEK